MTVERSIGIAKAKAAVNELNSTFGNDYLVCWNSFIHIEGWAYNVYDKLFKENKTLICAETPYIGREYFDKQSQHTDATVNVRVGFGDVSTYHPRHFNIKKQYSPERAEMLLKRNDIQLNDWREDGDHILIATQVPNDSSLRGIDIWASLQYDLIKLRQYTNRRIFITLHPEVQKGWGKKRFDDASKHYANFQKVVNMVGAQILTQDSKSLLQNCWAVICYSSGFSFDALVRGIPVITLSNRNFAAPICSHFIEEIENPKMGDRMEWLSNIAYCEWSIEEIRNGICKEHLLS